MKTMSQEAPYPELLADLVARTKYKEHWRFALEYTDRGQGSKGLTLDIIRYGPDSYNPSSMLPVHHFFIVPAASYNARSWQMWLFERIMDVEKHEAMEFFQLCDSPGSEHTTRPYAPLHGPGNDPYLVCELATDEERRTSFRGELNLESP
jgi:hypothetical protein